MPFKAIVEALLEHPDIDLNQTDESGKTLLRLAANQGKQGEILSQLLRDAGASINVQEPSVVHASDEAVNGLTN